MAPINLIPKNVRLWSIVVLAATFIVGAAVGAGLSHYVVTRQFPLPPPMFGPVPIKALGLSPGQMKEVDEIIESHRPDLDAILKETFPKIRVINEKIEEALIEILTPEQRARFEDIKERRPPLPFSPAPQIGQTLLGGPERKLRTSGDELFIPPPLPFILHNNQAADDSPNGARLPYDLFPNHLRLDDPKLPDALPDGEPQKELSPSEEPTIHFVPDGDYVTDDASPSFPKTIGGARIVPAVMQTYLTL